MVLRDIEEHLADDRAHHKGKHKKQRDADNHHEGIVSAGAQAAEDGQHDDTQNVINEGGTEQRGTRPGLQLTHLVEGLHRNGYGGGGKHRAHKGRLQYIIKGELIHKKEEIESSAQQQRHCHTGNRNDQRLDAGALYLLQVGINTGGKHEHDNADLRRLYQEVRALKHAEAAGAQNNTRQQGAHNLGHMNFFCGQSKHLCRQENQGQQQQISIGFHESPYPFTDTVDGSPLIIAFPLPMSKEIFKNLKQQLKSFPPHFMIKGESGCAKPRAHPF